MLKSTHVPAAPQPLPVGWTEHTSDAGHKYYYNAITGESTYTRPTAPATRSLPPPPPQNFGGFAAPGTHNLIANPFAGQQNFQRGGPSTRGSGRGRFGHGQAHDTGRPHRPATVEDRPKHKHMIPGAEPWVLVVTKLGRRFVHNTETKESLWKFPPEVMEKVVEFDRLRREGRLPERSPKPKRKESEKVGEPVKEPLSEDKDTKEAEGSTTEVPHIKESTPAERQPARDNQSASDSEYEYEEVVVEGDEDGEDDEDAEVEYEYVYEDESEEEAEKAPRKIDVEIVDGDENDGDRMVVSEDDGARPRQLDEEDEEEEEEEEEYEEATEAEKEAFLAFLSSVRPRINPFHDLSYILEVTHPHILDEPGYNDHVRDDYERETLFGTWCVAEVQRQKQRVLDEQRNADTDPVSGYLRFLNGKYVGSPAMILSAAAGPAEPAPAPSWKQAKKPPYWPEVKRKYRKDTAFADAVGFDDSVRERLYREFAALVVKPVAQLVAMAQKMVRDKMKALDGSLGESMTAAFQEGLKSRDISKGAPLDMSLLDDSFLKEIIQLIPVDIAREVSWAVIPVKAQVVIAYSAISLILS